MNMLSHYWSVNEILFIMHSPMKYQENDFLDLSFIRWILYIEDITCPRVDTNFIFECSTRYLTSERSSLVRYRVEHEKIKFESTSGHVIFCLLYRHRWNTRKTISWTNPLFAESSIIKYRSYAHSYFSREIEKISSVYLYSECYSNKAYKILLKRCVIVL